MNNKSKILALILVFSLVGCDKSNDVATHDTSLEIKLSNNETSLFLDKKEGFSNPVEFLSMCDYDRFSGPYTYSWFVTPDPKTHTKLIDKIHDEATDYTLGRDSNENGIRFFKYTFFVKNKGESKATFDMNVSVNEAPVPTNGAKPIIQYLRLMVFEDDNDPIIYAQSSLTLDPGPDFDYREYVTKGPEAISEGNYFGKAELFISDTSLVTIKNSLNSNQIKKYSLCFWLEGEDPECNLIPNDAFLNIDVNIKGYR